MKADHKVPEVLARDHAVGVLADQDKVWLERPAKTDRGETWGYVYKEIKNGLKKEAKRECPSNEPDWICSVY